MISGDNYTFSTRDKRDKVLAWIGVSIVIALSVMTSRRHDEITREITRLVHDNTREPETGALSPLVRGDRTKSMVHKTLPNLCPTMLFFLEMGREDFYEIICIYEVIL